MHTNLTIINFIKVLGENSAFRHQSQAPQAPQDLQAMLVPEVLLVSIHFAKSCAEGTLSLLEKHCPHNKGKTNSLAPKDSTGQSLSDKKPIGRGLAVVL